MGNTSAINAAKASTTITKQQPPRAAPVPAGLFSGGQFFEALAGFFAPFARLVVANKCENVGEMLDPKIMAQLFTPQTVRARQKSLSNVPAENDPAEVL